MHWQAKVRMGVNTVVMGTIAVLSVGCGSSGRNTTVVEAWDERPRFFTAEPGEEHSRFSKVVWYERPRFFTTAEGEDQSKFSAMWEDRPRIFSQRTVSTTSNAFPTTYESTREYRTIPVKYHDRAHCNCPHHRHRSISDPSTRTETTYTPQPVEASPITHTARVQLTSDRNDADRQENDKQESEFDTVDDTNEYGVDFMDPEDQPEPVQDEVNEIDDSPDPD